MRVWREPNLTQIWLKPREPAFNKQLVRWTGTHRLTHTQIEASYEAFSVFGGVLYIAIVARVITLKGEMKHAPHRAGHEVKTNRIDRMNSYERRRRPPTRPARPMSAIAPGAGTLEECEIPSTYALSPV